MEPEENDVESQRLYKSWVVFLENKDRFEATNTYLTKPLDDKDAEVLYYKSKFFCNTARCEEGVKCAEDALKLNPQNLKMNLQVPDALFDSNEFENSKIALHNNGRKFKNIYWQHFENRLSTINENYLNSLGEWYAVFAQNNNIVKIAEELKVEESNEPLWKILKEEEKCDVVSILEQKQEILHPREIERRRLCYKNFTQLYLHKGAKDIQFLAELRNNNETFLLPQTTRSTKKLKELVNENYDVAFKFLKMLQARGPVYSQKFKTIRDQLLANELSENHIFRIHYQTRRDMFNILQKLNDLKAQQKITKLAEVADYTIREYVLLKTNRIMPKKFEFINEVCNILALAYVEQLKSPDNVMDYQDPIDGIRVMLNTPVIKEKDNTWIFGDKSTFKDPEAKSPGFVKYTIRLGILERRLRFATFPIEKCYLYHQIALSHLKQSKNDMCIIIANKVIKEANKCRNSAWTILGYQLVCQTLIYQQKLERLREVLVVIINILKKSKITKILQIFEKCRKLNEEAIQDKMRRRLTCTSKLNVIKI